MSHLWMGNITFAKESYVFIDKHWLVHTYSITHSHMFLYSQSSVVWLFHKCDITHSQMWHDDITYRQSVIRLADKCVMTNSKVWHDSPVDPLTSSIVSSAFNFAFKCVTRLIHVFHVTYSSSSSSVPSIVLLVNIGIQIHQLCGIHACAMIQKQAWHDSFTPVTINKRDVTRRQAWHESFTCVVWRTRWPIDVFSWHIGIQFD